MSATDFTTLNFADVPGISAAQVEGILADRSARSLIEGLRKARVSACSGDYGALTVWKDDAGKYRGEFQRYRTTVASVECSSLSALRPFFREWLPALSGEAAR